MQIIRAMSVTSVGNVTSYRVSSMHDEFAGQSHSLHYSRAILSPLANQSAAFMCSRRAKQVIFIDDCARGPRPSPSEAEEQRGAEVRYARINTHLEASAVHPSARPASEEPEHLVNTKKLLLICKLPRCA